MVMKIVDVPEGAEEFLFEAYKNEMLVGKTQEGYVSSLPDAPTVAENATVEKRVIELPADVIELLENVKEIGTPKYFISSIVERRIDGVNIQDLLGDFVDLSKPDENNWSNAQRLLMDWYLGHVEFVPKKEPKFYVRVDVDGEEQSVAMWQNSDGESGIAFDVFMRNEPDYTETDADNLVAGLTALNARKVKVDD